MRRIARKLILAAFGLLIVALPSVEAQLSGAMSGPKLGYIWNGKDGTFRPVLGIPGSATIGDPLSPPFRPAEVVPLDGHRFLVTTPSDPSLYLLDGQGNSTVIVPGATAGVSHAVGSRKRTAAAIYYGEAKRVSVLTGLPAAPRLLYTFDVSTDGDDISKMAVNDDGSLLLYAARRNGKDFLYRRFSTGPSRLLTIADSVSDIVFALNEDAIVADAGANEVFAVRDPRRAAVRIPLAGERQGVSAPVAAAVSLRNHIYIANSGSNKILVLDQAGLILQTLQSIDGLSGLFPMTDSIYRLTDPARGTLYLLEIRAAGDRIMFVPWLRRNP